MTNLAQILIDGHRLLPSLLADLRAAERSIHVSVFLFFHDPIGDEIADVLIQRARAGVTVRVLLNLEKTALGDPFSTGEHSMFKHDPRVHHDPLDAKPLCERMTRAGIAVHDNNIDYDRVIHTKSPRLQSIAAQIRGAIDVDDMHIDHRKIIIVDGAVAYCGGANLGAQYLHHRPFDPAHDSLDEAKAWLRAGDPEPWWKWHDSLTRFEGPIAAELEKHFHARFVLDGGAEYEPEPYQPIARRAGPEAMAIGDVRVVHNQPDDQPNEIFELYLEQIAAARQSIFIENPYLYHPAIVEALCAAKRARPEVRVTVIVPASRHNDNSLGQDAQEYHYAALVGCGVELYEYRNHFNHFKLAVFDERRSIHGSTNLNFRSLERDRDFELVVLIDDAAFAEAVLRASRDVDLDRSERITPAHLRGWAGFLRCWRNPLTRFMVWRKML